MKKLMFALAASLPLFATADTNTVSRTEFDALKVETKKLLCELKRLSSEVSTHKGLRHVSIEKSMREYNDRISKLEYQVRPIVERINAERQRRFADLALRMSMITNRTNSSGVTRQPPVRK